MQKLIKPKKLRAGDTIATISLSGGRAGDPDMLERYYLGKKRLGEIFDLKVLETKNCLKGSDYIYKNPKARAEDLMEALLNPEIKAIFLTMGGDDGIRILPYIDFSVIKNNPKIFIGFSDGSTFHNMFTHAGVSSFYGANLLSTIAEPVELNAYTIKWIKKVLFSDDVIGEIEPCEKWTSIDWKSKKSEEIVWNQGTGYKVYQGSGKVQGHLMGGSSGPLKLMLGTYLFPKLEQLKDSIIFLEEGASYGIKLSGVHSMRALAATGMFKHAKALVLQRISEDEVNDIIVKVLHEEGLTDLPVFSGIEFTHSNPMNVLPFGATAEIDCDKATFSILESGVI